MDIIILIALLLVIASFVFFRVGDAFSPWSITACVWSGILILYQFYKTDLDPISSQFYTCLIIWIPIMILSSILMYYAFPSTKKYVDTGADLLINKKFFSFWLIISLVCTPIYLYNIYKLVSMFDPNDLFVNLRTIANEEKSMGEEGLLKYVSSINKALFIICIWRVPNISKWKFLVVLVANILCAVAIMEKTFMFFLIFVSFFVLYEKKYVKMRTVLISSFGVVFFFYGVNVLRYTTDTNEYNTMSDFLGTYILSPAVAFGKVQERLTDQFGTRSLTFFYSFLSKTGCGNYEIVPKLQEFVWVPIPTNVYTVFQPFFEDFGYKGVAFFASVYGFFSGWLYRQCRNGGAIGSCLYTYIVFILLLQFFQENLIISLSDLFQYLIIFTMILQHRIGLNFNIEHIRNVINKRV